jgi:hypothetical protein
MFMKRILKILLKLVFIGILIVPTMIGMIIFLEADVTQWVIYPIFLICLTLTLVVKLLIKKLPSLVARLIASFH